MFSSCYPNLFSVRYIEDRSAWRERSCAAGAANVRTDDADYSKVSK